MKRPNSLPVYFVCALVLFLPFSSWLVSYFGNTNLSLGRDVLIFLILFSSLITKRFQFNKTATVYLALAFIIWAVATFFWREASVEQWLRGMRFDLGPIVFFLSLANLRLKKGELRSIIVSVILSFIVISIFAILEILNVPVPLTSSHSGSGSLTRLFYIEGDNWRRIQAILAGPNALGLFLLVSAAYIAGAFRAVNKNLKYLMIIVVPLVVFTYSRSALLGLLLVLFILFYRFIDRKFGRLNAVFVIVLLFVALGFFVQYLRITPKYEDLITHKASSSLRVEQYERIWETRADFEIKGRGAGAAGPSSQNRIDGGPNVWTENVYLDIFETYGIVGLVLYLAILILLVVNNWRIRNDYNRTALLALAGFSFTGIFINYYTGQVGIYLFWLALALTLQDNLSNEKNTN